MCLTAIGQFDNPKFQFNLLAAIGSDDKLHDQLREGWTDAAMFVAFLQQVQRESGRVIAIENNVKFTRRD